MTPNSTTERLNYWADKTPHGVAMVYSSNRYTYSLVRLLVHRLVKHWQSQGIHKNHWVALKIKDSALELIAALSLEAIGAVRVSQVDDAALMDQLHFLISDQEITHTHQNAIFLDPDFLRNFASVRPGDFEFEFSVQQNLADDPVFLSSTSGTTGAKKYFFDTYKGLWANLNLMRSLYFSKPNTVFFSVYKLQVGAAYAGCCMALATGGQIIFAGYDDVLTQLETVPVSHVALVLKDAQAFRDKYPELSLQHKISSLRVLGASLPLDLRVWLEQHLAERVFNSYSSNETGQIGEVTAEGVTDIYPGVQVKIVDELGGDLGLKKQGLISVKSTQVISGYVWNEDLNPIHFQDGWFRTNDLGYLKSDRALVVLDRADNMLNVGGIKIPPSPMESRLKELLGVEALAIMNHPPLSDAVVVVIQSKQTAQFAAIRSVVDRFFRASFPVRVVFLDEIPLTESGKIKKFELSSLIPPAV